MKAHEGGPVLGRFSELLQRRARKSAMAAADAARDTGELGKAAELYRKATTRFPTAFGAWVQLGNMSKDLARYDDAEAAYAQALKLKPDDADVYLQLGHLAKLRGRIQEAAEHYAMSVRLKPDGNAATGELARLGLESSDEVAPRPDLSESAALVHLRMMVAFDYRRA